MTNISKLLQILLLLKKMVNYPVDIHSPIKLHTLWPRSTDITFFTLFFIHTIHTIPLLQTFHFIHSDLHILSYTFLIHLISLGTSSSYSHTPFLLPFLLPLFLTYSYSFFTFLSLLLILSFLYSFSFLFTFLIFHYLPSSIIFLFIILFLFPLIFLHSLVTYLFFLYSLPSFSYFYFVVGGVHVIMLMN